MQVIEGIKRVAGKELGQTEVVAILSASERKLLEHIKQIRYGRIERLAIQDGQPVRCDEAFKQVVYNGSGD